MALTSAQQAMYNQLMAAGASQQAAMNAVNLMPSTPAVPVQQTPSYTAPQTPIQVPQQPAAQQPAAQTPAIGPTPPAGFNAQSAQQLLQTIGTQNLGPGSSGPAVQALQTFLQQAGYFPPNQSTTTYYGDITKNAVSEWQQAHGISTNSADAGYFGPATKQAITGLITTANGGTQGNPSASGSSGTKAPASISPSGAVKITAASGTPYAMGDYSLVQFADNADGMPGGSYFLVDNNSKTIRPISDQNTLIKMFGSQGAEQALASVRPVSSAGLNPDGLASDSSMWKGYGLLNPSYAVTTDSSGNPYAPPLIATPSQLANRYGQQYNGQLESTNAANIDSALGMLANHPDQNHIPAEFIQDIMNDHNALQAYVTAMTYGGYTIQDIIGDVATQYQQTTGNTNAQNVSVISPTLNKTDYAKTTAGALASKVSDSSIINSLAIASTPNSLYATPSTMVGTPGGQANLPNQDNMSATDVANKMATVAPATAAYYDVLQQMLSAQTDTQQKQAQYNWGQYRDYMQRYLGVVLSNDALTAWDQINSLNNQFAAQGIQGSGIENEQTDQYLRRVRTQDQATRNQVQTNLNNAQYSYYTTYATPDQVAAFIKSNPQEAQQWGLTPSADAQSQLTVPALKAKYPGLTDAEAQNYINMAVDQNGNYRTSTFANAYQQGNNTMSSQSIAGQEYNALQTAVLGGSAQQTNNNKGTFSSSTVDPVTGQTNSNQFTATPAGGANLNDPMSNPSSQTGGPIKQQNSSTSLNSLFNTIGGSSGSQTGNNPNPNPFAVPQTGSSSSLQVPAAVTTGSTGSSGSTGTSGSSNMAGNQMNLTRPGSSPALTPQTSAVTAPSYASATSRGSGTVGGGSNATVGNASSIFGNAVNSLSGNTNSMTFGGNSSSQSPQSPSGLPGTSLSQSQSPGLIGKAWNSITSFFGSL